MMRLISEGKLSAISLLILGMYQEWLKGAFNYYSNEL